MKFAFCVLTLFIASILHAVESRLVGDKIEFANSKVNGVVCWTPAERDKLVMDLLIFDSTSPLTVDLITPSNFEVSIATSGIRWLNYSDFVSARDDKNHLDDKLDDMPASKAKRNKVTLDYLRSENSKR